MKTIKYLIFFLSALLFAKVGQSQNGFTLEGAATYNPFTNSSIQEKGLGYYPVDYDNIYGYNLGVGYERKLSEKSTIGIVVNGSKLKMSYSMRLIDPLDEIQPNIFNEYQFYGTEFNLYTFDANIFYQIRYKKFGLRIGLGLPLYFHINETNSYNDQTLFETAINIYGNDSASVLNVYNYKDLALRIEDRFTVHLGLNYMLDTRVALSLNISDNIFSSGIFQETKISGYTLKDGFNNPNIVYPLNETKFKKKLQLVSLGIRYYIPTHRSTF